MVPEGHHGEEGMARGSWSHYTLTVTCFFHGVHFKCLQPSQVMPPSRDQVFKQMSLCRDRALKPPAECATSFPLSGKGTPEPSSTEFQAQYLPDPVPWTKDSSSA